MAPDNKRTPFDGVLNRELVMNYNMYNVNGHVSPDVSPDSYLTARLERRSIGTRPMRILANTACTKRFRNHRGITTPKSKYSTIIYTCRGRS